MNHFSLSPIARIISFLLIGSFLTLTITAQEPEKSPYDAFLVNALFNKQVQRELELVDDQKNELEVLIEALQQKRKALTVELKQLRESGVTEDVVNERREQFQKMLESDKKETQAAAMKVLLPHQQDRLRQATAQFMNREAMKKDKLPTGLLAPEMIKFLEIDDTQARKIEEKALELRNELAAKIKKLNEEAIAELLKQLSASQRAKYEKLMGTQMKR